MAFDFPSAQPMGAYPIDKDGIHPEMIFDPQKRFGTVYWCEMTAVDENTFSFDLLLDTGALLAIQCQNVKFSRSKLG